MPRPTSSLPLFSTCARGRGRPARCTGGRRWSLPAAPRSPASPWTRGSGRSFLRALHKHTNQHVTLSYIMDPPDLDWLSALPPASHARTFGLYPCVTLPTASASSPLPVLALNPLPVRGDGRGLHGTKECQVGARLLDVGEVLLLGGELRGRRARGGLRGEGAGALLNAHLKARVQSR